MVRLLPSTLKVMSSCLEKPWLWIILICFIRVLFPLSTGPGTNRSKTGDGVSTRKQQSCLAVDAPTEHEDFHHIHLRPGVLTKVLLYFGALEFCPFTLLVNILAKAHSHTHLKRDPALSYIFRHRSAADGLWPAPVGYIMTPFDLLMPDITIVCDNCDAKLNTVDYCQVYNYLIKIKDYVRNVLKFSSFNVKK